VNPTPRPPEITTWVVAPSEGSRPLHVVFEATLVGGDRWVLSFGDDKVIEGTETVLREAHTYPHVGMYTATLEVFGPGGKASAGAVIVVHE
jgi:PKD repeat protein